MARTKKHNTKLLTLANFGDDYEDPIHQIIKFMRLIFEAESTHLFKNAESLNVFTGKLTDRARNDTTTVIETIEYGGSKWETDLLPDIRRIYSTWTRTSFGELATSIDDISDTDIISWFKQEAKNLEPLLSNQTLLWTLMAAHSSLPEKGISRKYREIFDFGRVGGKHIDGKTPEILQASNFEAHGGKVKISSAEKFAVHKKTGSILPLPEGSLKEFGKALDQEYKGTYVVAFSTNKALTARLDGGSRKSEYNSDAANTLSNRSDRFSRTNSYEYNNEGKLVIVVGLIDGRFFQKNKDPIRKMQEVSNNKDVFVADSKTFAKFMQMIDVPEVLTNTEEVIQNAFNQLAVEI